MGLQAPHTHSAPFRPPFPKPSPKHALAYPTHLNSGDCWYLSNSSCQCASVIGGRSPAGPNQELLCVHACLLMVWRLALLRLAGAALCRGQSVREHQRRSSSTHAWTPSPSRGALHHAPRAPSVSRACAVHPSPPPPPYPPTRNTHRRAHTTAARTRELPVRHREPRAGEPRHPTQHHHRVHPRGRAAHPPHQLPAQVVGHACVERMGQQSVSGPVAPAHTAGQAHGSGAHLRHQPPVRVVGHACGACSVRCKRARTRGGC